MTRRSILTGGEAGPIVRGTPAELEARHQRRTEQTDAVDYLAPFVGKVLEARAEQRFQDRVRELQEGPRETAPSAEERAGEREALRELMATPGSAYWQGPEAEQHQARYRELLGGGGEQ